MEDLNIMVWEYQTAYITAQRHNVLTPNTTNAHKLGHKHGSIKRKEAKMRKLLIPNSPKIIRNPNKKEVVHNLIQAGLYKPEKIK